MTTEASHETTEATSFFSIKKREATKQCREHPCDTTSQEEFTQKTRKVWESNSEFQQKTEGRDSKDSREQRRESGLEAINARSET